jgi:hypothetical protein
MLRLNSFAALHNIGSSINTIMPHYTKDRTLSRKIENYLDGSGSTVTGDGASYVPPTKDAFGRLRVSTPFTLFDSSHINQENDKWFNTGSGSAVWQDSSTILLSASPGGSIRRETKRVFAYQPGKSLLLLNTFAMADGSAGLTQRVGFYDDECGIYLERSGDSQGLSLIIKNSGGISELALQGSWNVDQFDGSGPSGITLDPSKSNIFFMDIEWLGVGSVRCGFVIDGSFYIAHVFHHANSYPSTYMNKATLPIRYELINGSSSTPAVGLRQICSSVMSEGGFEPDGRIHFARGGGILNADQKTITAAGTYYNGVTIRLKSTHRDAIAIPASMSVLGASNQNYSWILVKNATLPGVNTWSTVAGSPSVEYSAQDSVVTGGDVYSTGFFTSDSGSVTLAGFSDVEMQLTRSSASTTDTFTLAVTSGSGSTKFASVLGWANPIG